MVAYETLLDAARLHFAAVACSTNYTRAARHEALRLSREVAAELQAANDGRPIRALRARPGFGMGLAGGPAWEAEAEPLRPAA